MIDDLEKARSELLAETTLNCEEWTNTRPNPRFTTLLYTYIKTQLIDSLVKNEPEALLTEKTLKTLSTLICAGTNPEHELPRLKEMLGPSGVCGKALGHGEPNFSCLDCATDLTCVMCMECYNASEHCADNHNVAVHTSAGNGMCDCGDKEAWKSGDTCSIHRAETDFTGDVELMLPDTTRAISSLLFGQLLEMCSDCMMYNVDDDLPSDLIPGEDSPVSDRYTTVIYNDEVHSFDEVIDQLKEFVRCSHQQAVLYATNIDREGRMVVKRGGCTECDDIKNKILSHREPMNRRTRTNYLHREPLKTCLVSEFLFTLQNLLVSLVDWMAELSMDNCGFRRILCMVGLEKEPHSIIEKTMLCDVDYWKKAKLSWHHLLISSYILDPVYKIKLAVIFVKQYQALTLAHVDDDHDYSFSIISLTVQLFTVPSLARLLLVEHDALKVLSKCFVDFYNNFVSGGKLDSLNKIDESSLARKKTKRIEFVSNDVKYILQNIPDELTEKEEDAFFEFLQYFVEFLKTMHLMNPHIKQSGNHILHEKEWIPYFTLDLNIVKVVSLIGIWCIASKRLLTMSVKLLLKELLAASDFENVEYLTSFQQACRGFSHPAQLELATMMDVEDDTGVSLPDDEYDAMTTNLQIMPGVTEDEQLRYVKHDLAVDPVSFHVPLCRLLGRVLSNCNKFNISLADALQLDDDPARHNKTVFTLDVPLRTVLLCQQIEGMLWKRNGSSMDQQAHYYKKIYKSQMWDKDLLLIQTMFAVLDPYTALTITLHKYNIRTSVWSSSVTSSTDVNVIATTALLAEKFGALLLYILTERHKIGIGEVSSREIMRKEIIHYLTISDHSHSEIVSTVGNSLDYDDDDKVESTMEAEVDMTLKDVAVRKTKADGEVIFQLKKEFYHEFTPFYYHLSSEDRQNAESRCQQALSSYSGPFRPPQLPKLTPQYANLSNYFTNEVFFRFIYCSLERFRMEENIMVTDLMIYQNLYLVMFALLEERNQPEEKNKFSEMLRKVGVVEEGVSAILLIQKIYEEKSSSVPEMKSLMKWIIDTEVELRSENIASVPSETAMETVTKSKVNDKRERVRQQRELMMQNMKAKQAKFLEMNSAFFGEEGTVAVDSVDVEMDEDCEPGSFIVAGPGRGPHSKPDGEVLTCIMCKEEESVGCDTAMVYGCLVEESVVLRTPKRDIAKSFSLSCFGNGRDIHYQSCGHPMHLKCWDQHCDMLGRNTSLLDDRIRIITHDRIRLLTHQEFTCPLCKMVNNCVVPIINTPLASPTPPPPINYEEILDRFQSAVSTSVRDITTPTLEETEAPFTANLKKFLLKVVETVEADEVYIPVMTYKMIAHTFTVLELVLQDKPLLAGIAEYHENFIQSMLSILTKGMWLISAKEMNVLSLELMSLFVAEATPEYNILVGLPCILNMDVFSVFVACKMSFPGMLSADKTPDALDEVNSAGVYDEVLIRLCVLAEITKILVDVNKDDITGMDASADESDAIQLALTWGFIQKVKGLSENDDPFPCPTLLLSTVKKQLLPLLRKLTLFMCYSTRISGSPAMKEIQSSEGEFRLLMEYLSLPDITTLLTFDENSARTKLFRKWCKDLVVDTVKVVRNDRCLIELPDNYVDLLLSASKYKCPKIEFGKVQECALCLVCGDFVCYQSYCCQGTINDKQYGPCNMHAYQCSSGLGIFLLMKNCQILLLPGVPGTSSATGGHHMNGPYLDAYGETFPSARNKALYKSKAMYRKIELMWIKHEIRPFVARSNWGKRFIPAPAWNSM